jgi:hypothetical protein
MKESDPLGDDREEAHNRNRAQEQSSDVDVLLRNFDRAADHEKLDFESVLLMRLARLSKRAASQTRSE